MSDRDERLDQSTNDIPPGAETTRGAAADRDTAPGREGATRQVVGEERLTLSEEELAVGKRQVEVGEASVRKTVETERVAEQVPVTKERVVVERHPVEGGMRADAADFREETIRVPVREEEVVAEKRVVPKEEITIRKEAETHTQRVEADLRKERVEVREDVRGTADSRDREVR